MTRILFRCCLIALLLMVVSSIAEPVYAHGDEPRLEISVNRMNPGGVVELRGVSFEPEVTVTLLLVNSKTTIPLGEIVADAEGVFLQIVTLPVDLLDGTYNFLALAADHTITSPDLIVLGPPILNESGGQGPRDEEDSLLAPMPTFPPSAVPGAAIQTGQTAAPESKDTKANPSMPIMIALAAIVSGATFFFFRTRKR